MNPELRDRWTAKLRSGDYLQGRGALRKRGESVDLFCCLGVLCEIAVEDGLANRSEEPEDVGCNYNYNEEGGILPVQLEAWSGLDVYQRQELMDMNDAARRPFSQIADYIDENL